jgi:hypothetical protein
MKKLWLADHPGKTADDYEIEGSCGATEKQGAKFFTWMATVDDRPEWKRLEQRISRRMKGLRQP